jgi:hypothetical protein
MSTLAHCPEIGTLFNATVIATTPPTTNTSENKSSSTEKTPSRGIERRGEEREVLGASFMQSLKR